MSSNVALVWGHELDQIVTPATPWLWQGYLAPGNVTLLTSAPKCGKTTLLSILLHVLRTGGTLAGQPVRPGKAVVVSEETPALWRKRKRVLTLAEQVCLICRPFRGKPAPEQWLQLIDHLLALHGAHAFDLAVLDPLAYFLPSGAENHAGVLLEMLVPLQRLTDYGLALLLPHHPPKQAQLLGMGARGSGALAGFADILLELHRPRGAAVKDRRRQLLGLSRHEETPPEQFLELNAAGTDYACLPPPEPDDDFAAGWEPLRLVLESAAGKLTATQIERAWPADFPRPSRTTLWRLLGQAVAQKQLCRSGSGGNGDAFLYWLAEKEARFRADPLQQMLEEHRERVKRLRGG
jgi:hypothetical protein